MRRFWPSSVRRGVKAIGSRVIDWLREWTKPDNYGLVGGVVADATRSNLELMLENAWLRQQLIVVSRQVKQPQLSWRERGIMVRLGSKLRNWKGAVFMVQPATLLRWHRDLFRVTAHPFIREFKFEGEQLPRFLETAGVCNHFSTHVADYLREIYYDMTNSYKSPIGLYIRNSSVLLLLGDFG